MVNQFFFRPKRLLEKNMIFPIVNQRRVCGKHCWNFISNGEKFMNTELAEQRNPTYKEVLWRVGI